MKEKRLFKFGILALSIVLIACTGGSAEAGCPEIDGREINVVATTPMIGEFVSQVGGDNINLTVLMPAEADPHTYDPAPQDAGTIADADLVFYTGLKYEPAALIKLLENSACSAEVLAEVGESVFPIEFKEGGHDDHHDDHDEEGHDDHDEEGHDDDEEGQCALWSSLRIWFARHLDGHSYFAFFCGPKKVRPHPSSRKILFFRSFFICQS